MKTIYNGNRAVCKIMGKQAVKEDVYRMMRYVLRVESEDGILLHNVITGQMVLLSKDEAAVLNQDTMRPDVMKELIEDYFFVPLAYDELKTTRQLREILRKTFQPDGINSYTIFTTTNCNARCFYCYESDYPKINLSEHTATQIVDFIAKHKNKKEVILNWFGGEPLVCADRIDQICESLAKRDIVFHSEMTSNGYLFTLPMVQRAVDVWHLTNIQITLDGTEDIYNKTKAYVMASGSPYRRVLENIEMLLKQKVHVNIRMNLDQHNYQDLIHLSDELKERFADFENLYVYAHVVYKNVGFSPIARDSEKEEELYQQVVEVVEHLRNIGLATKKHALPSIKTFNCMADNPGSIIVYPDGRLFKCEHVKEYDVLGRIDDGNLSEDIQKKYQKTNERAKCYSCQLCPYCLILKECMIIDESYTTYACKHLIQTMEELVRLYYQAYKEKQEIGSESIIAESC